MQDDQTHVLMLLLNPAAKTKRKNTPLPTSVRVLQSPNNVTFVLQQVREFYMFHFFESGGEFQFLN